MLLHCGAVMLILSELSRRRGAVRAHHRVYRRRGDRGGRARPKLVAEIRPDNGASVALFEKMGANGEEVLLSKELENVYGLSRVCAIAAGLRLAFHLHSQLVGSPAEMSLAFAHRIRDITRSYYSHDAIDTEWLPVSHLNVLQGSAESAVHVARGG